ncbi:hypothetical protein ATI61_10963 [Archangium gephyra]|uniref:Uncharacterized protein n=1 Tax=Archangium gephyra TaxID=48 RepID=A0ABX9JV53_9BACT|nr:hypothetical protein ATI61_10963 [Archangium gephyra]
MAEVRARDVGHRVPTGDPFRRLRLRLCREPACASPIATRFLMRRFEIRGDGWTLGEDTTVPVETASTPPVRRLEFPLTAPLPEVLHWWLAQRRVTAAGALQSNRESPPSVPKRTVPSSTSSAYTRGSASLGSGRTVPLSAS